MWKQFLKEKITDISSQLYDANSKSKKNYNLLDLSFPKLINIYDIITMKVRISYLTTHWVVDTVHIPIASKL